MSGIILIIETKNYMRFNELVKQFKLKSVHKLANNNTKLHLV